MPRPVAGALFITTLMNAFDAVERRSYDGIFSPRQTQIMHPTRSIAVLGMFLMIQASAWSDQQDVVALARSGPGPVPAAPVFVEGQGRELSVAARVHVEQALKLRTEGRYAEADAALDSFGVHAPDDSRVWRWSGSAERAAALKHEDHCRCAISELGVGTAVTHHIAGVRGRELVVAAPANLHDQHRANRKPAPLDFFLLDSRQRLTAMAQLGGKGDDVAIAFHPQGNEAIVERSVTTADGTRRSSLHVWRMSGGTWSYHAPFVHNTDGSNTGSPALSSDGKHLYFHSDRTAGAGGWDIWMCDRTADGTWSEPRPLDGVVNTEGDERRPAVSADGALAFASNGHMGLGGFDLFLAVLLPDGNAGRPRNLGAPVNSAADEMALVVDAGKHNGVFERLRGDGSAVMFKVAAQRPLGYEGGVDVVTLDRRNGQPVPGTELQVSDSAGHVLHALTTANDGHVRLEMDADEGALTLVAAHNGYRTATLGPVGLQHPGPLVVRLPWLQEVSLWMHVANSLDGTAVDSAALRITEAATAQRLVSKGFTDDQGDFRSALPDRAIGDSLVFRIALNKQGFYPRKGLFLYHVDAYGEIPMHEHMDPAFLEVKRIRIGDDVAKEIHIRPIYFGQGNAILDAAARIALDQIVEVLHENPRLVLEVASHTDSRGDAASNAALSKRRARATADHMIAMGIAPERLVARGMGEAKPINQCKDGVHCTDEQHAANRRTEFVVLEL